MVCFKFLVFFFSCGFDDFSGFMGLICWRFRGEWCLDMENVNIVDGGRGVQQEENRFPLIGYLGLFETCISGYLGLFETCVIEFVQI